MNEFSSVLDYVTFLKKKYFLGNLYKNKRYVCSVYYVLTKRYDFCETCTKRRSVVILCCDKKIRFLWNFSFVQVSQNWSDLFVTNVAMYTHLFFSYKFPKNRSELFENLFVTLRGSISIRILYFKSIVKKYFLNNCTVYCFIQLIIRDLKSQMLF